MQANKIERQHKVKSEEEDSTSDSDDYFPEITEFDWYPLENRIKNLNKRLDLVQQSFAAKLNKLKQSFIQEKRRRNVMFYNIPYTNGETKHYLVVQVCLFVNYMLNVSISLSDIDFVLRVGRGCEPRPVRVTFLSYMTKHQILSNSKTLKLLIPCVVYVSDDFPSHVVKIRKRLYRYMVEAQRNGFLAKLDYDKLIINSIPYSLDFLEKMFPLNEDRE